MYAGERLARNFDLDQAGVERVVQQLRESVLGDRFSAPSAQANPFGLFKKAVEVGGSGGIHLEQVPNQRRGLRVRLFRFATADVAVAQWCGHGQDALLQPPIEALLRFFLEVADKVGGDHGLDVGGQTTAAGIKVQAFVREVYVNSSIDHFAQISPIAEIAGATINLVDH